MNYRNCIALLLLCYGLNTHADDTSIGYVKVVKGEAWLTMAGNRQKAEAGSPIMLGEQLDTGDDGSIGITFKDETIISIGPNTSVTVDEFLYQPAQKELKLSANILKGTLHYISGVIAKLKPESVSIKTPSGFIGVRGTRFLVKVEES